MNAQQMVDYIKRKAEKVNSNASQFSYDTGFAIPIPEDVSEKDLSLVDKELLGLMWSFERAKWGGRGRYYVLFPFG